LEANDLRKRQKVSAGYMEKKMHRLKSFGMVSKPGYYF
jgi:hypothetical protein